MQPFAPKAPPAAPAPAPIPLPAAKGSSDEGGSDDEDMMGLLFMAEA